MKHVVFIPWCSRRIHITYYKIIYIRNCSNFDFNYQFFIAILQFVEMVSCLLSICCMLLLGFADDIFDLRWRHKLFFPTLASLPLLIVYHINFSSTTVILPKQLRHLFGTSLDIGCKFIV